MFFTFSTPLETAARDMISYFGTYLAYEHTTDVLNYLKPDAAKRAKTATWDPKKYEAISEENNALNLLMDETETIEWLQDPNRSRGVQFLKDPEQIKQDMLYYCEAF